MTWFVGFEEDRAVQIEDYFDFLAPDDIRIKGTRIGIESILYEYVHNARSPEEIRNRLPTVSLEQVYATILYYLHDREAVGGYLADSLQDCRAARAAYEAEPPPVVRRLRAIKDQLAAYPPEERDEALREILNAEQSVAPEVTT